MIIGNTVQLASDRKHVIKNMNRQMTLEEMNDEFVVARTNKKEFLNKMDSIIPWDTFVKEIEPYYYKGERDNKPYPLELMLRTVRQRQAMTT